MRAGTTRLQLQAKGDDGTYTDFANIVVAFAFLGIPLIGWLLDKKVMLPRCATRRTWTEHSCAIPRGPVQCLGPTCSRCPPLPQGYGITLGTINGLNMISSILQAIPNLEVQVITLITWMISRFFMYSRCAAAWGGWPQQCRPRPC